MHISARHHALTAAAVLLHVLITPNVTDVIMTSKFEERNVSNCNQRIYASQCIITIPAAMHAFLYQAACRWHQLGWHLDGKIARDCCLQVCTWFNCSILHATHQWLVLTCGMNSRALQCISKRLKATTSIVRCHTCIHVHTHAYICVAAEQKLLSLSKPGRRTKPQHVLVLITQIVNRPRSQTNCIADQPRDASIIGCFSTQLIAKHVRFDIRYIQIRLS